METDWNRVKIQYQTYGNKYSPLFWGDIEIWRGERRGEGALPAQTLLTYIFRWYALIHFINTLIFNIPVPVLQYVRHGRRRMIAHICSILKHKERNRTRIRFCLIWGTSRRYIYISLQIKQDIKKSQTTRHQGFHSFLLVEGSGAGSGSVQIITHSGSGGPQSYKSYESGSRGTLRIRIYELGAWCSHII